MSEPGSKQHRKKRRRAALRHAALTKVPIMLSGGRLNRARPDKDFIIQNRTLQFDNLPDELSGLKIAHVSDFHIGELITPTHLEHIVKATNELQPDLIALTGDFIDFSNQYLPAVTELLTQFEAPHGVYLVLGNHDYLDNAPQLIKAFKKARLKLLLNEHHSINIHHKRVNIHGIDWAKTDTDLRKYIKHATTDAPSASFDILLAHHPHAFDTAAQLGINLTLSGHTHGGQVILSRKRSKKGSIGLASLSCRYPMGLYSRSEHKLHVTTGVGSWFFLRFRCPAEISLLELQTTY